MGKVKKIQLTPLDTVGMDCELVLTVSLIEINIIRLIFKSRVQTMAGTCMHFSFMTFKTAI